MGSGNLTLPVARWAWHPYRDAIEKMEDTAIVKFFEERALCQMATLSYLAGGFMGVPLVCKFNYVSSH